MKRALVAIGVDRLKKTVEFPSLNGAARGAREMAQWGNEQGMDVTLFTDEDGGTISISQVFNAIDEIVGSGAYSQLVVYFSGHGVLVSPEAEVWLLSEAVGNPNEAINVGGSITAARQSGIPHLVFISDACRSLPQSLSVGMLSPGRIFSTPGGRRPRGPEIDVFYAALPGDPAYELRPGDAGRNFQGLLTKCLLGGLEGAPISVIDEVNEGGKQKHVVASRRLKNHLEIAVPDAAAAESITLNQYPDIRVESALPKYLSDLSSNLFVKSLPALEALQSRSAPKRAARKPAGAGGVKRTAKKSPAKPTGPYRVPPPDVSSFFDDSVHFSRAGKFSTRATDPSLVSPKIFSAPFLGPSSFSGEDVELVRKIVQFGKQKYPDSGTGFAVRGGGVASIRIAGVDIDISRTANTTFAEFNLDWDARTVGFIRFTEGHGVVLPVVPGFTCSVLLRAGSISTVFYTRRRGDLSPGERERLNYRRAQVAVAARLGKFQIPKKLANKFAAYLRRDKELDPTLGLFAAYAYAQAGNDSQVLSVMEYVQYGSSLPLFDVAMLAAQRSKKWRNSLNVAPWMPMLTQGWMQLGDFEQVMPSVLREARKHLIPGLWTTFSSKGMDILEAHFLGEVAL